MPAAFRGGAGGTLEEGFEAVTPAARSTLPLGERSWDSGMCLVVPALDGESEGMGDAGVGAWKSRGGGTRLAVAVAVVAAEAGLEVLSMAHWKIQLSTVRATDAPSSFVKPCGRVCLWGEGVN